MRTKLLVVIGMAFLGCLVVSSSASAAGSYDSGASGPWEINLFFESPPYGEEMDIDIGNGIENHPHYAYGLWEWTCGGLKCYPNKIDWNFNITSAGWYRLTVGADQRPGNSSECTIDLNGAPVGSYQDSAFGWVAGKGEITLDIQPLVGSNTLTIDVSDTAYDGIRFNNVRLDVTPPPAVTFSQDPVLSWFGDDVIITPTVTSDLPPVTYLWSDGSTDPSITVYVLSGMNDTFTLTATDALGNVGQGQVTVVDQSDKALENLIDLLPPGLLNPNTSRGEAKQGEWR